MVAEAEVVCHQSVPVSDVPVFVKGSNPEEIDETLAIRPPKFGLVRVAESDLSLSQLVSLSLSLSLFLSFSQFLCRFPN